MDEWNLFKNTHIPWWYYPKLNGGKMKLESLTLDFSLKSLEGLEGMNLDIFGNSRGWEGMGRYRGWKVVKGLRNRVKKI